MTEIVPNDQPPDPFRNWSDPNLPGPEEVVARTLCKARFGTEDSWRVFVYTARAVLTALTNARKA